MTVPTLSHGRKTLAVLTLVIALVLEIVDLTIVNTALPAIQADYAASPQTSEWVAAGYALAFAMCLMLGGRLGDALGYRRMFVTGVAGFTLASVLCGVAGSGTQLVVARILQGVTGAMMAPQSLALMQILFDPLERVHKMALFGVIGGLAAIAGPILGGVLIHADLFGLGWRMIFLVNAPVGLIAMLMGLRFLPAMRSPHGGGLDLAGTALFALATAALVWPLIAMEHSGAGVLELGSLLGAVVLYALGWRHVKRRSGQGRAVLFSPELFTVPTFRLGLAIAASFALATGGFLLIFAFALQRERGLSPLQTGLLHMPFSLGVMLGIGGIGRRLLPRYGRWVLVAGALTMAVSGGTLLLAIGLTQWPLMALLPLVALAGMGMGMASGSVGPVTVAHVDSGHAGAASGLLKTGQQLGTALGVALIGGGYFASPHVTGRSGVLGATLLLEPVLLACALLAAGLPSRLFGEGASRQA
ncbi:MFS transporter [Novosphingobium rosa]|uniref:MFS transporter n=1 Tax=Novosphingobium rosa TaxID=76978 RepID=UPI00082EF881|nr:MFS transporter [Novosphingobium rosa]